MATMRLQKLLAERGVASRRTIVGEEVGHRCIRVRATCVRKI